MLKGFIPAVMAANPPTGTYLDHVPKHLTMLHVIDVLVVNVTIGDCSTHA